MRAYNVDRYKRDLQPNTFRITYIELVKNPYLQRRFQNTVKGIPGPSIYAFHGTRARNIENVLKTGLLPAGHPLIPTTTPTTDTGYFGAGNTGVYVAAKLDYALQYSNELEPLFPGQSVKVICVRMKPGTRYHCPGIIGPQTTVKFGHHSHVSPSFQEY